MLGAGLTIDVVEFLGGLLEVVGLVIVYIGVVVEVS